MRTTTPLLPLAAATLLAATATAQGNWTEGVMLTTPAGRSHHGLTYDSNNQQTVLFGGIDIGSFSALNDTWLFDGVEWVKAQPASVPPARGYCQLAFDPVRNVVVMCGGDDSTGFVYQDTWEWNGTDWSAQTPTASPPALFDYNMCWDSARQKVVLYGGRDANYAYNGDTWECDGTTWSKVNGPGPGDRDGGTMAHDPVRGVTVLFGGSDTIGMEMNDTWELGATGWKKVTPTASPNVLVYSAMAFDPLLQKLVLHGGRGTRLTGISGDTYTYDGTTWGLLTVANSPGRRAFHKMATDTARNVIVHFGGEDENYVARTDTYEFSQPMARFDPFGEGCPGVAGTPELVEIVPATVGGVLVVEMVNLSPNNGGAMFSASLSRDFVLGTPLPFKLDVAGMPGCVLYTGIDVQQFTTRTNGGASTAQPIPNNPALAGREFHIQGLSFETFPGNGIGAVSNAARVVIGP